MHEQLSSASGNCRKINSLHLQPRNSPTVLNAGFQFAQFWDGRSSNLEAQAKEPMLNPDEMGLPAEADLLKRLRGLKTSQTRFPEAFSDRTEPISIPSARHSIVSGGYRIHCGIPPLPLRQRTGGASAALTRTGARQWLICANTSAPCTTPASNATFMEVGGMLSANLRTGCFSNSYCAWSQSSCAWPS
jgi:hypothetical protein